MSTIKMRNPGGFTINIEASAERPLALPPRSVCRNEKHSFDEIEGAPKGARSDPNYRDAEFGGTEVVRDGGAGLFGDARSVGESSNEDTYMDLPESEMAARRRKLRKMLDELGLETEENPERARRKTKQDVDLQPVPGFPLKSPLE